MRGVITSWRSDAEELKPGHFENALLVVPEGATAHRLYFDAATAQDLARLCALPLSFALDTGLWSLVAKIVRDNPYGTWRTPGLTTAVPVAVPVAAPASPETAMLVEALVTAVAAGARSQDGSHVAAIGGASDALTAYIRELEVAAGRRRR